MSDYQRIDRTTPEFHSEEIYQRLDHLQELEDEGLATDADRAEAANLLSLCDVVSPVFDDVNLFFGVFFVRIDGPFSLRPGVVTKSYRVSLDGQAFLAVAP
ncbi:hypothetical protein [Achromobacter insuavis]|uniref:hypothetical protein n=1 Tax=Achromobacter insuavis TaxID=1287735 RepID=UPI001F12A6D0|nr:hypothetical protein [Achromobacter insuavis]